MSGGVDSSVSAHLLLQQNYRVTGVFMQNWDSRDENGSCPSEKDWIDVQRVCSHLGIQCYKVDYQKEYWVGVFDNFLDAYARGATPNPDVDCNRVVKFGRFLDQFIRKDTATIYNTADYIATGHYARTRNSLLLRPTDSSKDQTYYLSTITSGALSRTLFPLGHLRKTEVKQLARDINLPSSVSTKPESMGICFVGKRPFNAFLNDYIAPQPGLIRSIEDGTVMGTHQGIWHFTVGQRARVGGADVKWYVARTDLESSTVFIAPGRSHPSLFRSKLEVKKFHWIAGCAPPQFDETGTLQIFAKYRYLPAILTRAADKDDKDGGISYDITFRDPQLSVAVGQHVALYDGDVCLGGGAIDSVA
ncbi:tRNA methyl transferase [Powellomyces hirtus]|nr:tRNA methyl transferase [Powellomyces hirtus]